MFDFIYTILEILYNAFVAPISHALIEFGSGASLDLINIKVGFGSIEWFNISLDDLLIIVLGIAVSTIILVFIFKLLKWLTKLGGRKKW